MKIRIGTDIIEIERVKKAIEETDEKFCERVYTTNEIEYCESKKTQKYQHYAARFAAKEAVFKALSETLTNKYKIEWRDIEIRNEDDGRPYVKLKEKFAELIESIDISISHCKEYAVANVILIERED